MNMLSLVSKSFRPHQGIIEFNNITSYEALLEAIENGFRPHQGIIEFNLAKKYRV